MYNCASRGSPGKEVFNNRVRGEVSSVNQLHTGLTMRILFDSGSQRSYMTKRARKKLNLSAIKSEKLLIKTFGQ